MLRAVCPFGVRMKAADKTGQSMIEACLAILIICLIFAGIFQVSQIFVAREILSYSASRAARARTVGFNKWMVRKVARVGCIANAGRIVEPAYDYSDPGIQDAVATYGPGELWENVMGGSLQPPSTQVDIEVARIPEYLWAPTPAQAKYVLDYEDWDSISVLDLTPSGPGVVGILAHIKAQQDYPMKVPAHGAFYNSDTVELEGEAYLDNHYPLYLDDDNL